MKYASIALACLFGLARAQEAEKPPEKPPEEGAAEGGAEEEEGKSKLDPVPTAPVDPVKVISDLTLANAAEDVPRIDEAAKEALRWGQAGAKDEAQAETMAKELTLSIKAAKGNWGTLDVIVKALGELRTKEGAKALKKLAFQKKAKDEQHEKLQATAIVALGKLADPREVAGFEEVAKHDSKLVAKAAYEALGCYGTAKAKVRKEVVELLMKRMDMEYPASKDGKAASAEKQERWTDVSPAIVSALKALCRDNTINDIDNWREWWKENKKKPWKDEDGDKES
jgi:hypothetical protein